MQLVNLEHLAVCFDFCKVDDDRPILKAERVNEELPRFYPAAITDLFVPEHVFPRLLHRTLVNIECAGPDLMMLPELQAKTLRTLGLTRG